MKRIKLAVNEEYIEQSGIFFHKHTKQQISEWGYWACSDIEGMDFREYEKHLCLIYICQYITSKTIRNKAILKKYNNFKNQIQLVLE